MKIAMVSLYLPSGSKIGVGYVVHYLANEMVKRGHDVTVFSQSGLSPDSLYKVEVVPRRPRLATFGFAWDLRGCDFSGFDVLNAHGDDWFLWGKDRPRHIHTFMGSCLAEALHATTLAGKLRMGALAACEVSGAYVADVNVAISANTRRYLPRIRHIIPPGVALETFRPVPESEKFDKPTVLLVGTLHGRKRGAMLREAFHREVRAAVPEAQLIGVCEPPEDDRGPDSGERWTGRISTEELRDLYAKSWVFCLPSSYEGFGVPYIEAMASGTAVVATSNLGAREVTRGGRDGILCRDEDLGQTLVRVLQDDALRTRLRDSGLRRAQDFAWDLICAKYLDLYQGRRPRRALSDGPSTAGVAGMAGTAGVADEAAST